jgi:glycosyltransferase involved in cell wall biosynthesis
MEHPLKLTFVSKYASEDVLGWSGIPYFMKSAFERQGLLIDHIGPLPDKITPSVVGRKLLYSYILRRRYMRDREPSFLRSYATYVSDHLNEAETDVVFSPSSLPVALLKCRRPIVFWTDSAFAGMVDFYSSFSHLCDRTVRNGHEMERAALQNCALAIYSSEWAARTAMESYGTNPDKVKVVPFGANLPGGNARDDVKRFVECRPRDKCRFLFLGVDWNQKGGDIAIETAAELNRRGLETELTIAGCLPPKQVCLPEFVKVLGFISKQNPEGFAQITGLLRDSHFLILPSRAECYGIVFAEACSFAVPCLSTNVGGIPSAVRDGLNGRTFAAGTFVSECAEFVINLFEKSCRYRELALSAFDDYSERLNWDVACRQVTELIRAVT